MKGVIFTEFLEMVEATGGLDLVDEIIDAAGDAAPTAGAYTAVGTYDHTEIVALVGALSEKTETPVPELLKSFGAHLFQRFTVLYPRLFEKHSDAFTFLENVDTYIHVEVLKLYPNAELPRFEVERPSAPQLLMTYHSSRHLEDLAEGLIRGCLDHFGARAGISRETSGGAPRFVITQED